MQKLIICSLAILGVLMCLIGIGTSQVTFSKGWGPGKRSFYDDRLNCKLSAQSTASAYHTLVSEMRQLRACETARSAYSRPGDGTPMESNVLTTER